MSDVWTVVGAGISGLASAGAGVAWLWRRVEKGFSDLKKEVAECEKREAKAEKQYQAHLARSARRDAKQLIVIELLWQVARRSKAAQPILERCKEHLDELKADAEQVP